MIDDHPNNKRKQVTVYHETQQLWVKMQLATPSLLLFLIGIAFVAGSGVEDSKKHHPLAKHRQRQHNQQQIFVTAPPSTTQTPKDEPSLEEILSGSAVQSTQHTPTSGQLSQHRLYNNG